MSVVREGACVNGVYQVEWKLGEGAFAHVWRVRHRFLGRQAMKVFKSAGATTAELDAMLAEARLLSQQSHPNIVQVFDANVIESADGPLGFFTMTHVAGGTLDRYWKNFGAEFMPVEQVVEIARQVCAGMQVAHRADPPIVHRDLKPQNILIGYGGSGLHVRVSDFGLAGRVSKLSLLASVKGTPAYKAPESLETGDSTASDVWAIGATMYRLLTDRLPYPILAEDDFERGTHFGRPLRPPSVYNFKVDPGLEAIVLRCLAIEPRHRYRDAGELLCDLVPWKPRAVRPSRRADESLPMSKSELSGRTDTARKAEAEGLLHRAIASASNPSTLMEAADLLEAALTNDPALKSAYETRLRLWRRGISM